MYFVLLFVCVVLVNRKSAMNRRDFIKQLAILSTVSALPISVIAETLKKKQSIVETGWDCDPFEAIQNAQQAILENTGCQPRRIVMNREKYIELCEYLDKEPFCKKYVTEVGNIVEVGI